MRKVNKKEGMEFALHIEKLKEAQVAHEKLIADAQAAIDKEIQRFLNENKERISNLELALVNAATKLEEIAQDNTEKMENFILERSDKWRESNAAHCYNDWAEDWNEFKDDVGEICCFSFELSLNVMDTYELKVPELEPKSVK